MGLLELKRDEYSGYGSIKLEGLEDRARRYEEAMMARRASNARHRIADHPTCDEKIQFLEGRDVAPRWLAFGVGVINSLVGW